MDNGQMPQVQQAQPQPSAGMPIVQQVQAAPEQKKDVVGLVKTIAIIVVSLIAVTFIGLFIWMYIQYSEAHEDVQGQIDIAVAEAKDKQAAELEAEFLEREKLPYKIFSGPVDYGQLTFKYPRTWSVYVEASADKGGDFKAYFNPNQVDAVGEETINALRVTIQNKSFDDVTEWYQDYMDRYGGLSVRSITFGENNLITGNMYTGTIPNTELNGYIVIFKIRDKTATVQTDSVLFEKDYNDLLNTIQFNA
ncbi:hypothetical protein IJH15_02850 [Candidatus Saccharibacteria bacterium]|nr:hypothetical protein [Candidatus Saccharibacteria bacterium]MBR3253226.1 hypothetical protein [Candidatus Saccharibacteria bacterium]